MVNTQRIPASQNAPTDSEFRVIGTRPIRHDGADKVTGRAKYGGDFHSAGLLHGKVLRSPHAHARIISIDTSRAEALDGVRAVVTARDLPQTGKDELAELKHWNEGFTRLHYLRDNILADRKVLYHGHAVAAVAAASQHVAEEALDLITVEYELLPPVLTIDDALRDGAPVLHDDLPMKGNAGPSDGPTNLAERTLLRLGDADRAFAQADVIVERTVDTSTVHQGYIEPHSSTVSWETDGRLNVWTSTQGAFYVREMLAIILGIPESQIHCVPMEIGGGFGGKFEQYEEPAAALLSRKTGRPVKMTMNRAEELEATGPAPGSSIWLRMGATNDGRITAVDARLAYESGAYPDTPVGMGSRKLTDQYKVENLSVESLEVVLNKPKSGWFRAPGSPQIIFVLEQVVDELATRLGMDPIELRLINATDDDALHEVLRQMRDHPHWNTPLQGEDRGRGVAIAYGGYGGGNTTCTLAVNADGTASLLEGCTDIGGSRTAIAMQAAEALGIRSEDIIPAVGDTGTVGYNMGTSAGRTTYAVGIATYAAAEDVKGQLVERAARVWGMDPETLEYRDGSVRSTVDTALSMSFAELAARTGETGGPVVGSAAVTLQHGKGESVGVIFDVHVDRETGKVQIERCTSVMDVGRAVHPSYVEGQMQGGVVQGIGWATGEEYWYDDQGRLANTSLLDYRMMTTLDVPMVDTVIVEVPDPDHPFGVKGASEAQVAPPGPALANAIHDAVGVRMDSMPMTPQAVAKTLWESRDQA